MDSHVGEDCAGRDRVDDHDGVRSSCRNVCIASDRHFRRGGQLRHIGNVQRQPRWQGRRESDGCTTIFTQQVLLGRRETAGGAQHCVQSVSRRRVIPNELANGPCAKVDAKLLARWA
eukprot:6212710-Pleurochrysis_carterae.AAC.4